MNNFIKYILLSLVVFSSCTQFRKMVYSYNDYCKILKNYSHYSKEGANIGFEYNLIEVDVVENQQIDDLEDSLQDKPDIEKVLYLMHWVHLNLEYDYGYSGSSKQQICNPRNYQTILNADPEKTAIVCRDMAITLTELLLKFGYKSRFVCCMPYDLKDPDAHVVSEVKIESDNRWIMLDPSFNCYITNDKDEILSIKEIRKSMLNGISLYISSTCSLNSKKYSKEKYKEYMSKNVFRFERPLKSKYNYESDPESKYVILLPEGYNGKQYSEDRILITTNEEIYWE